MNITDKLEVKELCGNVHMVYDDQGSYIHISLKKHEAQNLICQIKDILVKIDREEEKKHEQDLWYIRNRKEGGSR